MKRYLVALVTGGFFLSSTSAAIACFPVQLQSGNFRVEGVAFNESDREIYSEHLSFSNDQAGGILTVDYKNPSGNPLAVKTVEYNCNPTTPSFTLRDLTNDTSEGVILKTNDLVSFQSDKSETMIMPAGNAIIDAGFDHAVKLSWDELMRSNKVTWKYLFARNNKFLKLKFQKAGPPDRLSEEVPENVVFFKVAANNFLFRMLSSPIFVGYDRDQRHLKYYYGPSNLPMFDDGKNVLIKYSAHQMQQ